MLSTILKFDVIITPLQAGQLIARMQADNVEPCRKLHNIPLEHPFITLQKIGFIRGSMSIAIIERQFNTHLMDDICYLRGSDMRHLYFARKTKIALHQEG